MDKRDRSELFRQRLHLAMNMSGYSQSKLAKQTQANRSTISQLLDPSDTRLPGANLAAECAEVLGISTDWLLGLTDRPERAADILDATVQVADASRAPSDDQMMQWHQQADGYKIRHVPATLPDILKTQDMLRWEYNAFLGKTPKQAIAAIDDKLSWLRTSNSDYEICFPIQEILSLINGQGYYQELEKDVRRVQIEHMLGLCENLYPSLRVFLFDEKTHFSAPLTVFGHTLGVVYVGSCYFAFRQQAKVKTLTQHFDNLIRHTTEDSRGLRHFVESVMNKGLYQR